ncbi:MAG: TonB-dependent receptor [Rhodanobacteraceae bacterium]
MNTPQITWPRNFAWRTRALPAAIMLGLLTSAPGLTTAQTTTASAAQGQQPTPTQQDGQAAAGQPKPQEDKKKKPKTLGTIEVTATGRVQQIITVPYNISAVTGSTIEQDNILDNAELFRSIPGVNVVDSGPRNSSVVNNIRIRGINVDSSALGDYAVSSAAPVATYIDSVPLFANFLLSDINRVEVLRGPQGTLYGSGSLGGTVRYILNKPQLNQFNGSVSSSLSSVDGSSGIGNSESFVLNAPLGSTVALRVDGTRNDYPGVTDYINLYKLGSNGAPVTPDGILSPATEYYDKKDADTVKQNYGRISVLWKPNDIFNVQLSYMAQADRFGSRLGTSLGTNGDGVPYQRNQLGAIQLEPSNRHVHLTSLEANLDLGFATLTSSTSYYNHKGDITSDNTGFYAQNDWFAAFYYNYPRPMETAVRDYGDRAFTQEFRLVSKSGGPFDYILGAYYHDQHTFATQDSYLVGFKDWWDAAYPAFADSVINDNDFHYIQTGHYDETALYGQGTWHATDSLQFTLGVRSFRDDYTATVDQHTGLYTSIFSSSFSTNTQRTSKTLFYGNMSWWFNDSNQLYATVSQGYRHGGANGIPITGYFAENPAWQFYRPDTVLNHEVGFKGLLGGLTYTADVFYTNWQNPQLNTATTNWGFFAVQNMGRAVSKGVELEVQGKAGEHFTYGLGYTYTDSYLTENAYPPDGTYLINTSGAPLPGVSKNHFNASGNYSFAAWSGLVRLHLDASYQSSSQNSISVSPLFAYTLPGFTILNASASYSVRDWTAILWLKNLTNTRGATGIYTTDYMGTSPAQNFYGNDSKLITTLPRTVGVTFTYRF